MRLFALIACVLGVLVLVPAAGAGSSTQRASGLEAALLEEVNAVRSAEGLAGLRRSAGLSQAADVHNRAMARTGVFAHAVPGAPSLSERMSRYYVSGGGWSAGENLALFGPTQPTARAVVNAWLESPPHRANLLARGWRDAGISVRLATVPRPGLGSQPRWLITLDLGRKA